MEHQNQLLQHEQDGARPETRHVESYHDTALHVRQDCRDELHWVASAMNKSSRLHPVQKERVQGARAERQFIELPSAWFMLLVRQHLKPAHRLELFCTCKGLALEMTRTCSKLSLKLGLDGRHGNTRLQSILAANCNNIHLTLFGNLPGQADTSHTANSPQFTLDIPAVWPCITQLMVDGISLSKAIIKGLHLQQLTQLHTIRLSLLRTGTQRGFVNVTALQNAVQRGGLPALCNLHCCSGMNSTDTATVLKRLGPVLGQQVTQLTLEQRQSAALTALRHWPSLQSLRVLCSNEPASNTTKAVKQLFKQSIRQVSVPAALLEAADCLLSTRPCAAERFEVLGTEVCAIILSRMTLHRIQHLVMPGKVTDYHMRSYVAALQLSKCRKVTIVPVAWSSLRHYQNRSSIPASTPTLEVPSEPETMHWLLQNCHDFHGALSLNGWYHDGTEWMNGSLAEVHLNILQLLPAGVHTLALYYGSVAAGFSWAQVIARVPSHVRFLMLRSCHLSMADLQHMLDQPPPPGLQRLNLSNCHAEEEQLHAQHAEMVAAAVSAKWPGVTLELDLGA